MAVTQGSLMQQRFPALAYHNYRLWLAARLGWTFGWGLQNATIAFFAYELTRSAAYLGSVSFSFGIPILLFAVYGGVLADRVDRRRLVVATQLCWLAPPLFLLALSVLGLILPWHLIAAGLAVGFIHAFDNPARAALMPDLVNRHDLANASMLNSLAFYVMQVFAPALGGLVYAVLGPAWCFLLCALSFALAGIVCTRIRVQAASAPGPRPSALSQMSEGLRYALTERSVRVLLALVGLTTMFGLAATVLIPAWAVKIMRGDATTNGMLTSAVGIGTIISMFAIALLGRFSYKGKLLTVAAFVAPVMWLIFAQVRWLPLSVVVLVGAGAFSFPVLTLSLVLLQLLAPDALRGRLMGIVNVVNVGMQSLGALFIGVAAQQLGEPHAIMLSASILLAAAFAFYMFYPELRAME